MSDDKQQILAVYERINDAMVNKDTETLDTIFEDNHKFVHMSGYQQSKQEWLEQIESEKMRYFKTMPQKTTITINGHTAILICDIKIDARIYGNRNTWSMRVKMYFEKRGVLRPGWFTNKDEIDYELTKKGEPFKGHDISRKSLADLIVKLAVTPGLDVRHSLGVSKPNS